MDPASNKLRLVKTSSALWNTSIQPFRRDEFVLARLRIGHTLHTHGYLMEGAPPPYAAEFLSLCLTPSFTASIYK
jgi:hypothetical protein